MTDDTDNQLDIEDAEIMAEIAFEHRMRREMDAEDIAAEQAEMRAEGEEDYEPTAIEMALRKAEARAHCALCANRSVARWKGAGFD